MKVHMPRGGRPVDLSFRASIAPDRYGAWGAVAFLMVASVGGFALLYAFAEFLIRNGF